MTDSQHSAMLVLISDNPDFGRMGMAECHCGECDPELHRNCSADCLVYDCVSPEACCNNDCLKDK